jgi:intracellular septation protein A
MNQLIEWSPLLVFFLMFKLCGLYWATAALMLTSTLVLFAHRHRTGSYKTMHIVTA